MKRKKKVVVEMLSFIIVLSVGVLGYKFIQNCELPEKCPLNRFWVKYRI